jgi:hypothetical protein
MGKPSSPGAIRKTPECLQKNGVTLESEPQVNTSLALTETELAIRWNLSNKTLQRWRSDGIGPIFCKLGSRVMYLVRDIQNYEREISRYSTSARVAL